MTNQLQRIAAFFCAFGLWIAGFALFLMVLLVLGDVIGRKFLGYSLLIADEYAGYSLVAVTFMGGAYTLRTGSFTRMEVLYNRISGKGRWIIDLTINLVGLAYLLIIDYWLWVLIKTSYSSGETSISIAQTPLYIPQFFMGLGVTFLAFELVLQLVLLFRPARGVDRTGDA